MAPVKVDLIAIETRSLTKKGFYQLRSALKCHLVELLDSDENLLFFKLNDRQSLI